MEDRKILAEYYSNKERSAVMKSLGYLDALQNQADKMEEMLADNGELSFRCITPSRCHDGDRCLCCKAHVLSVQLCELLGEAIEERLLAADDGYTMQHSRQFPQVTP